MTAIAHHAALIAAASISAYTTLNPSDKSSSITLSGGNLVATGNTATSGIVRSIKAITDKKYFECVISGPNVGNTATWAAGIANASASLTGSLGYSDANGWAFWAANLGARHNGITTVTIGAYAPNVLGFAVDETSGNMWISINGVWISGDPVEGTSPAFTGITGTIYAAACPWTNAVSAKCTMRFDPALMSYTLPTGYSGIAA
ncbi:hypothetical protein PY254_10675 [Rhodanobacter sp. AS-Z3]|uniref:hypothetical protein n=1 Tax=Rhodanobacter sp. AS-Z3 TaxID=3031330 RepID=UPI0024794E31|nr:hypothetical protein [Rhodanobacter sp. AS-Z3]WEN13709.1 hypothetical protein PY254_10675 [Rhodanobacter sp. AS-Z3]